MTGIASLTSATAQATTTINTLAPSQSETTNDEDAVTSSAQTEEPTVETTAEEAPGVFASSADTTTAGSTEPGSIIDIEV